MNPLTYALRLLKIRLRSVWEIDQALLRRKALPEERQAVIEELKECGLLDDARFALSWVRTRDRLSPKGDTVLRMELRQKGIADELIMQALQQRDNDEEQPSTEEQRAREVVERRARLYVGMDPEVRKRRVMGLLQRRGFSYDVIRRILNT